MSETCFSSGGLTARLSARYISGSGTGGQKYNALLRWAISANL